MKSSIDIQRAIAAVMDGSVPHTRGRVVTEWPIMRDAPLVRAVLGRYRVDDDGRMTDPEAAWMAVAALRWAELHDDRIPAMIATLESGLWGEQEAAAVREVLGPDAAVQCRAAIGDLWCPGDVAGVDLALSALEWVTR